MSKKPILDIDAGDSSSDEAPEEISVSTSRQQRVEQLKGVQDADRRRKQEEKRRRRERNEIFRLQKEKKIKDLTKRKLPQDVLDAVSANQTAKSPKTERKAPDAKKPKKEAEETTSERDSDDSEESNDDSDNGEEEDGEGEKEDRLSDSGMENEDEDEKSGEANGTFIPLSSGGHLAVATDQFLVTKRMTAAQGAFNFKQNRLFNPSVIPRQTTKQRRARQQKKTALQGR